MIIEEAVAAVAKDFFCLIEKVAQLVAKDAPIPERSVSYV